MLTVTRHGITSRFDDSPWPEGTPALYKPFLKGEFYEQKFLDHIRDLGLRGIYIDAGSCVGTHSVWFGLYCPSTHVHSFDPRPHCAEWTQMNLDANDLTGKATVHQVGVGAGRGRASADLDGHHYDFDVVPLDAVVDGEVAVIKIDVEGMEEQVLRGASRILSTHHPVVFAEAWGEPERAAIEAVLAPFNYRPTGRVFNATPTYEFTYVEPPSALRRAARRLPAPVRRVLIKVRAALRGKRPAGRV